MKAKRKLAKSCVMALAYPETDVYVLMISGRTPDNMSAEVSKLPCSFASEPCKDTYISIIADTGMKRRICSKMIANF